MRRNEKYFSGHLTKPEILFIIRVLLRKRGSKNKRPWSEVKNFLHGRLTKGNDFYMISILRWSNSEKFFKNQIQRTDKCEHRKAWGARWRASEFHDSEDSKILRSSRLLKPKEKNLILLFQFRRNKSDKTEIELKSLILAQIERWRHALHMQVERQRGSLLLAASGARVSNASERVFLWGITVRKDS